MKKKKKNPIDEKAISLVSCLEELWYDHDGNPNSYQISHVGAIELTQKLLIALHDSINSPKGTVPKSAEQFYCQDYFNK